MNIITSYQYTDLHFTMMIMITALVVSLYWLVIAIIDYYTEKTNKLDRRIVWFGCATALFFGLLLGRAIAPAPITRYEVTLDAEYPANEFLDNYTVIRKLGHSYLVEKKE